MSDLSLIAWAPQTREYWGKLCCSADKQGCSEYKPPILFYSDHEGEGGLTGWDGSLNQVIWISHRHKNKAILICTLYSSATEVWGGFVWFFFLLLILKACLIQTVWIFLNTMMQQDSHLNDINVDYNFRWNIQLQNKVEGWWHFTLDGTNRSVEEWHSLWWY